MKKLFFLVSTLVLVSCSQYSEPQGLSNSGKVSQKNFSDVVLEARFASIKTHIIDKKCLSCHKADSASEAKALPFETEAQVIEGSSDLGPLVVPGRPAESVLYRSVVSDESTRGRAKVMPPANSSHGALTAAEQHVIAAWIAGVAVKKTAEQPKVPNLAVPGQSRSDGDLPAELTIPTVVDFALIKAQVLEKKCMGCHKPDGKADEIVFGTRDELVVQSNSFGQSLVVIGKPEQSLLYISMIKDESIRQDVRLMPPKKDVVAGTVTDVTERDVALIQKWIADGAK